MGNEDTVICPWLTTRLFMTFRAEARRLSPPLSSACSPESRSWQVISLLDVRVMSIRSRRFGTNSRHELVLFLFVVDRDVIHLVARLRPRSSFNAH